MNKKQKKMLKRILIALVLFLIYETVAMPEPLSVILFFVTYFVIGYDILLKAWKGIKNRQVFDENFLMAIATVGAIVLGEYSEGGAVMLFYQI